MHNVFFSHAGACWGLEFLQYMEWCECHLAFWMANLVPFVIRSNSNQLQIIAAFVKNIRYEIGQNTTKMVFLFSKKFSIKRLWMGRWWMQCCQQHNWSTQGVMTRWSISGKIENQISCHCRRGSSQHFHLDFHRRRLLDPFSSQHQYVYRIYGLQLALYQTYIV